MSAKARNVIYRANGSYQTPDFAATFGKKCIKRYSKDLTDKIVERITKKELFTEDAKEVVGFKRKTIAELGDNKEPKDGKDSCTMN